MLPYPCGRYLRLRLCLMPCLDASASYFHRRHSTHRLIPRHCHEDSGVPLLYTPQTSPLGATKCITQRDYQIRHCLIVLALCQSKEYAAIRFHRRGLLSPVSLQYQQTDFNLLAGANVCGPGYSFAFWLKNLQTQNDVFASASSGEHSFCTRIFKPKGEHPSYASHAL